MTCASMRVPLNKVKLEIKSSTKFINMYKFLFFVSLVLTISNGSSIL